MIALDTNILLRLVLQDDKEQGKAVARLLQTISEENPAYISIIVMVELYWVLQNKPGHSRKSAAFIIGKILDTKEFEIEHEEIILGEFGAVDFTKVDLADWLICICGQVAGCSHTVTFDRKAARKIPTMELLT